MREREIVCVCVCEREREREREEERGVEAVVNDQGESNGSTVLVGKGRGRCEDNLKVQRNNKRKINGYGLL